MRIVIDCRMLKMSGIGVYLENFLNDVIPNNVSNYFLLLGNEADLERYVQVEKCQVLNVDISIFSLKELFFFPVELINTYDVFYTPNYNIPCGIKIPIFCTIHDVLFLDVAGLTTWYGKIIRKYYLKRAINISKSIFTVSQFSENRIRYHFDLDKEVVVTYNSIHQELKLHEKSKSSPYDFPYILFVGNIKKHKGIKDLLAAYQLASNDGFNMKLLIVGEFENFKSPDLEISSIICEKSERVIFTGRVSNDHLYNIISHSNLLVQPSVYEGFGLPPLEALYLGCNVLISDIPVFHEIFEKFDVNFFNVSDISDLKHKLILFSDKKKLNSETKQLISEIFNQSIISNKILNQFVKFVN